MYTSKALFHLLNEGAGKINNRFKEEITMNSKFIWSKGMLRLALFSVERGLLSLIQMYCMHVHRQIFCMNSTTSGVVE